MFASWTIYEIKDGIYTWVHMLPVIAMIIGLIIVHLDDRDREWDWLLIWGGIMCVISPWCTNAVKYFKVGNFISICINMYL